MSEEKKSAKDFKLLEVIKANLKEGTDETILDSFNIEGIKKAIDEDYVNPIVGGKKEELRTSVKQEAVSDFLKEAKIDGVENVDQFNAYVKRLGSTTDEKDAIITRLTNETTELQGKFTKLGEDYGVANKKLSGYDNRKLVTDRKFLTDKTDDILAIAMSKVTDEMPIDKVLDGMIESHKYFMPTNETQEGSRLGSQGNEKATDEEITKWEKEAGL
jgi:hypothetical protein